jgi:hypothetical protein
MVHSPKLAEIDDDKHQTDVGFTLGETIHFGSLEFIANLFGSLSLFDKGNVSGAFLVSERPSRPNWPNYTTTSPHSRQSGA